jgi:hypothetical protein
LPLPSSGLLIVVPPRSEAGSPGTFIRRATARLDDVELQLPEEPTTILLAHVFGGPSDVGDPSRNSATPLLIGDMDVATGLRLPVRSGERLLEELRVHAIEGGFSRAALAEVARVVTRGASSRGDVSAAYRSITAFAQRRIRLEQLERELLRLRGMNP